MSSAFLLSLTREWGQHFSPPLRGPFCPVFLLFPTSLPVCPYGFLYVCTYCNSGWAGGCQGSLLHPWSSER